MGMEPTTLFIEDVDTFLAQEIYRLLSRVKMEIVVTTASRVLAPHNEPVVKEAVEATVKKPTPSVKKSASG
jgi:hypothetical protein